MMRNLRRAMGLVGVVAGFSTLAATLTIGCSGDDNSDGGTDSGPDVTTDADAGKDVQNDVVVKDVVSEDVGPDGPSAAEKFRTDLAAAFCNRFQSCCNGLDGGTFDYNACVKAATVSAWNGSNTELNAPEVLARNNVTVDSTAATSCLAGMATISCPTITSTEANSLTDNCFNAAIGTLNVGADCVASIECKPGEYCKFEGLDAGKTDAGTQLGQCANLIANGGLCGQAPPYGDPVFASEECAYKGWHSPAQFCDYDSYPDAGGYTCHPLRANGDTCFNDDECASALCGAYAQDCINTTCTCTTSRDYSLFCSQLAIKDAGTD